MEEVPVTLRSKKCSACLKVCLIEGDKVGGTCLHKGCIPTKALLHCAEIVDNIMKVKNLVYFVNSKHKYAKAIEYKKW